MMYMRALPQAYSRGGIILKNEIQVCCDCCRGIILDWCSEQVVSYPGLPIPKFDYQTGEMVIDHYETLCDECLPVIVQELEEKGILFEKDGEGIQITIPVPEDYVPPKPSWWKRLKGWFRRKSTTHTNCDNRVL